jgi:predicted DNA-binding transcriptional regulator AlpA
MAKSQNFTLAQPAEVDVVVDAQKARVDPALAKFDSLPDAAHVRLPVVLALYACSRATVWRHVKAGLIPVPVKFSARITAWQVGALRKHLIGMNKAD